MPRSPCHFALLAELREVLKKNLPDIAELVESEPEAFCAGGVAPDAMRYFSDLGKYGTHFYSEGRKETWGCAVSGMFEAHPELSDPSGLEPKELSLLLGYISHLTVDEAFRDTVTIHVHGIQEWRPIIQGLWSFADEIPGKNDRLGEHIEKYSGTYDVGFIAGGMVKDFLSLVGPWADTKDPWEAEKAFLHLAGDKRPEAVVRKIWMENRESAQRFIDPENFETFIQEAVRLGVEEVTAYVNGGYCKMPCS